MVEGWFCCVGYFGMCYFVLRYWLVFVVVIFGVCLLVVVCLCILGARVLRELVFVLVWTL